MFVCRILFNPHTRNDYESEFQTVKFTGYVKYEANASTAKDTDNSFRFDSSNDLSMINESSSDSSNEFGSKSQSVNMFGKVDSSLRRKISNTSSQECSQNKSEFDKNNFYLTLYGQLAENRTSPHNEFTLKMEVGSLIIYAEPQ